MDCSTVDAQVGRRNDAYTSTANRSPSDKRVPNIKSESAAAAAADDFRHLTTSPALTSLADATLAIDGSSADVRLARKLN